MQDFCVHFAIISREWNKNKKFLKFLRWDKGWRVWPTERWEIKIVYTFGHVERTLVLKKTWVGLNHEVRQSSWKFLYPEKYTFLYVIYIGRLFKKSLGNKHVYIRWPHAQISQYIILTILFKHHLRIAFNVESIYHTCIMNYIIYLKYTK